MNYRQKKEILLNWLKTSDFKDPLALVDKLDNSCPHWREGAQNITVEFNKLSAEPLDRQVDSIVVDSLILKDIVFEILMQSRITQKDLSILTSLNQSPCNPDKNGVQCIISKLQTVAIK